MKIKNSKIMKNIKLIASIALFTLGFTGSTIAQTAEQTEKATKQTERMQTELGLSSEQTTQVQQINVGIIMKNDGIRSNESLTQEEKSTAISSNNEARKEMFKGVLTAEQYVKFEEMQSVRPAIKKDIKKIERPIEKKATENN